MSESETDSEKKPSARDRLTEAELQEFQEIFNLVDVDHGGTIDEDELGQLMNTLGLRPTKDQLDAMVAEIDEDGNGEIDFDEFVEVMCNKINPSYTLDELRRAFRMWESQDGPMGCVSRQVLEDNMIKYLHMSHSEVKSLMDQAPQTKSGYINYEEFISIIF